MTLSELLRNGPELKLERARHHINDLSAQFDAFLAEKPFVLWERHQRKASKKVLFVKQNKPVPPIFSLILGDAVHNLRSALDHTLFIMARDRADKPTKIQFPFPRDDTPESLATALKDGRVKFAGKKVEEQVRALKPQPNGNGGLYFVHEIDIQDKHQLLVLSDVRAVIHAGTPAEAILRDITTQPMVAGSQVVLAGPPDVDLLVLNGFRYATRDLPDSESVAKVQPTFAVTFAELESLFNMPVVETLRVAAEETRLAVEQMVAAYLDPDNTFPT